MFLIEGLDEIERDLRNQGQARTLWKETYVDLFLATTEFHTSMSQRVERQPFASTTIPVLSIEDLLICKTLFDRPKDWVDIAAVACTERDRLDYGYIRGWLEQFMPPDDPRHARFAAVERDN